MDLDKPPILEHLKKLTTKIGLYQHCRLDEPDLRHGYSIDDNARAIIALYLYIEVFQDFKVIELAKSYFDYIKRAQLANGYFHNFADSTGKFIDRKGSQDSQGRTIWALGYIASHPEIEPYLAEEARKILEKVKFDLRGLRYIRAKAFAMLGYYYIKDKSRVRKIADQLIKKYRKSVSENWFWFEDEITYSNAILPYSLFLAYDLVKKPIYLKVAKESLSFLRKKCLVRGVPAPIGQKGWYFRGKRKAVFDQQVVDATDMVLVFEAAWRITGEKKYLERIKRWLQWFYGNNILGRSFIDEKSGGCYDGLTKDGFNMNMGAESQVCYLIAYLTVVRLNREADLGGME